MFVDVAAAGDHNIRARILRSGLTVSLFSLLETYIEDRLDELMSQLNQSAIHYQFFGPDLKEFLTLNAIHGLANRVKFLERPDRLAYIEGNIPHIAGFFSRPPSYSNFGFSPQGSNVSDKDIGELAKVFGLVGGWGNLSAISTDIGIRRISLVDDFRNFSRARNKSAHDATANIPSADLANHLETALAVGISSDIAISHSVACYVAGSSMQTVLKDINTRISNYRYVDERVGGTWSEIIPMSGRVCRNYPDLLTAKNQMAQRTRTNYCIVRDMRQAPMELF